MPADTLRALEVTDDTPSRSFDIADLAVGDEAFQRVTFTQEMLKSFGEIARDAAPVHHDPVFARDAGFDRPIIQGMAVASRFSRLIGMYLPGRRALLHKIELRYRRPTFVGDPLVYRVQVERLLPKLRSVRLLLSVEADGHINVDGLAQCILR